jgi:alcohol dehydrogenase
MLRGMKTLILQAPGRFEVREAREPGEPGAGEALVRVRRVGVCGTDISGYLGRMPFIVCPRILGHELGISVEAVGPGVVNVAPGESCSVEPYMNCGRCVACRRGRPNCCVSLQVIGVHADGGMRERFLIRADKLHPSRKLSHEQLALVETLAIGCHCIRRVRPEEGENVLVIGAGPIGLTVVEFARLAGARVILMDLNDDRAAFAAGLYGVPTLGGPADVLPRLRELTGGELPTAVVDATGSRDSMSRSLEYLAHGGRACFVGITSEAFALPGPEFHRREATLLGSRNALPEDFVRIIDLIEQERIDTTPWITHRARPEDVPGAFEAWIDPASRCLKAIVEF